MHFPALHQMIWIAAMVGVSGYALWRGGRPERLVAAVNLVAWAVTLIVEDRKDWFNTQWGILSVDIIFLGVLVWLALTRDRWWILFAAAFQLLGVVTHMAILSDTHVRSLAYLRSLAIWSYLVLVALGVGAAFADRRRREAGRYV